MYEIIKGVISAGGYKLTEIQQKIKKMYLLGDLTDVQMDDLLALASGGISTDAERPETLSMIRALSDQMAALEARVKALEGSGEESTGYPTWKPWDGMTADYQQGAIVTHNDRLWESTFAGQNVWEPGAPGTESLWVEYTPAE